PRLPAIFPDQYVRAGEDRGIVGGQVTPERNGSKSEHPPAAAPRSAEATQAVLAAIVDSCQDAIYSGDMAGIILTWNAGAERLFGFTASEMIGQSVGRLYPAGHNAELQDILAAVHAGEGPTHLQRTRQRKDGSLVQVAVTISPIWNASGTVIGA